MLTVFCLAPNIAFELVYNAVPPSWSWEEAACALFMHSCLGIMVAATVKRLCILYIIGNECTNANTLDQS